MFLEISKEVRRKIQPIGKMCIRDRAQFVATLAANRSAASGQTITAVYLAQRIQANVAAAQALNPVSYTHLDVYKRQDTSRSATTL